MKARAGFMTRAAPGGVALVVLLVVGACTKTGTEPDAPRSPAQLVLEPRSLDLVVGDTARVAATVLDGDGRQLAGASVLWATDDASIVSVVDGLISALAVSPSIRVRATSGGVSASLPVTIRQRPVASVELEVDSLVLSAGYAELLGWVAVDASGDTIREPSGVWATSDASVAEVAPTGLVRARSPGTAWVRVGADGASDSAVVSVTPAPPGLSPDHEDVLTRALERMSAETPWPFPPVVDSANQILWDPSYEASNYESFFRGYMQGHRWTEMLWFGWLGYPVWWWGPEDRRIVVQEGLYNALRDDVRWSLEEHGDDLGFAFSSDPTLKDHVLLSARFAGVAMHPEGRIDDRFARVHEDFSSLVADFPAVFAKRRLSGADLELGMLRAYGWILTVESSRRLGLDRSTARELLELTGRYGDIFDAFGVLVLDNQGLDAPQLDVVYDFLAAMPSAYANRTMLMVMEHWRGNRVVPHSLDGGVNIFGVGVGAQPGQPFPADFGGPMSDTFTEVLAHEWIHIVAAIDVEGDATWAARVPFLIDRAGRDRENYLRSMIPDGYFVENPQEFLASIGNQWFTDSEHTLRLGRARYLAGRPEPLHQALFFADIMAQGGDETRFYRHDLSGVIEMDPIDLERDTLGFIAAIAVGDSVHHFRRDAEGLVLDTWSVTR